MNIYEVKHNLKFYGDVKEQLVILSKKELYIQFLWHDLAAPFHTRVITVDTINCNILYEHILYQHHV